jgi:fermentation-respiration switch protein FrsA (DUF1100 family)
MSHRKYSRLKYFGLASAIVCALAASSAGAQTTEDLVIRGQRQVLHLYGPPGGEPVVVSSGDGGWMHLAPHVAETLASRGFFVVGFDVRAYLESFTSSAGTLKPEDEPADYRRLVERAAGATHHKPTLIGVSEGAGLSVLAATDPETRGLISGVIGLGLPNLNELGWRWKDSVIYVTHGLPHEPTFSTRAIVNLLSPLPLAAIHSTRDEFVPVSEVEEVLNQATGPKRLWIVPAANHRFSDNLDEFDKRLFEAIDWVKQTAPR